VGNQHLNILVVDDQPGVRYLLDAVIREEGHDCYLASNGLEAVELVETVQPALVFMDIRMPVMDGAKAIEIIYESGFGPDVVIMTAFTEKDVIDRSYKHGVIKCIIKPFDIDEIRGIIRETARRGRPRAPAI